MEACKNLSQEGHAVGSKFIKREVESLSEALQNVYHSEKKPGKGKISSKQENDPGYEGVT